METAEEQNSDTGWSADEDAGSGPVGDSSTREEPPPPPRPGAPPPPPPARSLPFRCPLVLPRSPHPPPPPLFVTPRSSPAPRSRLSPCPGAVFAPAAAAAGVAPRIPALPPA